MSTDKTKLRREFQSWNEKFTEYLRDNAPATLSRLEKPECALICVANLLFQYVEIQLPQREKLRKDFKALQKDVRRLSEKLSNCANEVELVWSKNLYGQQNMLLAHQRVQSTWKENVPDFEDLPRVLKERAAYMRWLCQWYRTSNAAYRFGPEHLLLAVQKHLKSCTGKESVDNDLADLLEATYAASGITKEVDPQSLAKRLRRLREPLNKLFPSGTRASD